eukprot:CAMPEP_0174975120 /NCGR_PEP_ID=MMETSP0004_2-20121128/12257_1 /TAXON_ID=420556 /ORGANISM="Ochromonas sp., Strain CCMP1393" /LENGTH=59 /DNA_ID=CAMNT_0016225917 /DNA_START=253 /DNA_END=432 /DNA_ORIENTATION=+
MAAATGETPVAVTVLAAVCVVRVTFAAGAAAVVVVACRVEDRCNRAVSSNTGTVPGGRS